MLRVVEDDPENRRLVLRAPPWTALDIARRVVLTALLLGCFAGAVAGVAYLPSGLGFGLAVILTYVAWIFSRLVVEQVAEIVLDGASRSLRVRRRGRHIWRTSEVGGRLDDDALLRLRAGLVAGHGFRRLELGFDLHEGRHDGGSQQRLAPTFSIEGIDRRDEARAFAEAVAHRLGLGLGVEQDDALMYQVRISSRLSPPPAVERAAGYRQLPRAAKLARDALPSFEPPRDPPALALAAAAAELQLHLVRAETGELVAAPASVPIRWKRWSLLFVTIQLALSIVGAAVAWSVEEDPVAGALLGLGIPVLGALWVVVMLALAVLWIAAFQLLYDVLLGLLASERDTKPRWFNTLPLARWRLGDGALYGPLRRLVWRRGDVLAFVVVDHWRPRRRTSAPEDCFRYTALCVRTCRGWLRLASTREVGDNPLNRREVPTSVIALALELARTLDVPLRGSP